VRAPDPRGRAHRRRVGHPHRRAIPQPARQDCHH
jgi:hypothetical protein